MNENNLFVIGIFRRVRAKYGMKDAHNFNPRCRTERGAIRSKNIMYRFYMGREGKQQGSWQSFLCVRGDSTTFMTIATQFFTYSSVYVCLYSRANVHVYEFMFTSSYVCGFVRVEWIRVTPIPVHPRSYVRAFESEEGGNSRQRASAYTRNPSVDSVQSRSSQVRSLQVVYYTTT